MGDDSTDEHNFNNTDYGVYTYCSFYSYFLNLNANIGNNNETNATCGYVALAMLLDYYDTFLNDNIVAEKYDVYGNSSSSPGTLYELDSGLPTNSVGSYYNYLRNNYKNSSLHAYLILLHKNALYYNPFPLASTYAKEFGTKQAQLAGLATNYLTNLGMQNSCSVVYYGSQSNPGPNEYSKTQVISFIINEIDNGYPVVCGFNGHARIVYGYTDDYKFIMHNGYTNLTNEEFYIGSDGMGINTSEIGFVSLHFNYSHSHSYNYINSNSLHYCYCGDHIHDYTSNYVYHSSNYHKSYCPCGAYILELHSYRINIHNENCICGSSLWD